MSDRIYSYISLPGQAEEAFTLWHSIFGGTLNILKYGDQPAMEGMPFTPDPQAVAHATLVTDSWAMSGGDSMGDEYAIRDTAYSMMVEVDSTERAEEIFAAFTEAGGKVNMPFAIAPWGTGYGQVFDPFGVMWSVSTNEAMSKTQNEEAQ